MSLAYHAENAASSERARRRMQREGCNMRGDPLWSEKELEVVRQFSPDIAAIRKRLRHRSVSAIRAKARSLGLVRRRTPWSGAELARLRKMWPTCTKAELAEAFPTRSYEAVKSFARWSGIRRARKPYKATGNPAMDKLLGKCFEVRYTLVDLDKECRAKGYFQNESWRYARPNYKWVMRAIEFLEGEVEVKWPDDE